MKVHILQLLCPSRHCIAALAYQSAELRAEAARLNIQSLIDRKLLAFRCGICGSTDLRYEDAPTIFKTMAEAEPTLKEMERANLATRAMLDQAGLTADAREGLRSN